jgi:hypothetical protein
MPVGRTLLIGTVAASMAVVNGFYATPLPSLRAAIPRTCLTMQASNNPRFVNGGIWRVACFCVSCASC